MMKQLADTTGGVHVSPMLTGDQIRAARQLAGIARQDELGELAGVGEATIQRAEAAGKEIPGMNTTKMAAIVRALESKGVAFMADGSVSLVGGLSMRLRK